MIAKSTDYQITELGVLPREWKVSKLYDEIENVLDFRGRTPKKLGMDWGNGNIPALSANNVRMGYIDFNAECYLASEELYEKWMTKGDLKKGDVLMTMEAPLGKVAQVPDNNKYILSQRVIAFKPKATLLNVYLKYYLMSDLFQSMLEKNATGTTAKGINQKNLSKLEIIVPTLNEQQKIAEILTSADEQIEKTRQLIEKTKELKIGLMQQLLTKGIEHFSFKKTVVGEIPETWNVYKIEDVALKVTDGEHKTPSRIESGELLLSARNIQNGRIDYSNVDYISEDELNKITKRCHPEMGDILLSCSGSVGRVCIVPDNIKFGLVRSVALIKIDEEVLSSKFLMYMLQSPLLQKQMEMKQSKLAQANLFLRDINSLIIPFPSLEEQLEISKIISSVDEQLNVYEKEKEKQIELKKALMQQLLTGKIRVTV